MRSFFFCHIASNVLTLFITNIAIQLELDSFLPIKTSALCRAWADERVKLREEYSESQQLGYNISTLPSSLSNKGETSVEEGNLKSFQVLVAIVDAVNLCSSVGLQSLETFCTLRTVNWEGAYSSINVTGFFHVLPTCL